METKKELGLALLAFALVTILSLLFQVPLTYHEGQGWDGVSYFKMAQQLSHGLRSTAEGPFAFRLGTPWLVALLFPSRLLLGFRIVNLVACLLTTVLLLFWLRRFVSLPWLRLVLVVGFLTQWHAPLRFTMHYAAYTDPWLFVFLLGMLLALPPPFPLRGQEARRGEGGLLLLCFLGALFREAVLVVPLALAVASRGRHWLPLLASLLGVALTHLLAQQSDGYSFARTVGQWAYNKPLLVYVHGLFIAFGPALVLPLVFWRTAFAWLKEQPILAWVLAGFLVLGWVGGSDTERIVYWAMPVAYPLLGVILEKQALPRRFLFALAACQLASHRIFWTLPDYPSSARTPLPLLTPPTSLCQYPDLWSYQATRAVQATALVEYVVLMALLGVWIVLSTRRQ